VRVLLVEDNPADARLVRESLLEARALDIDLFHVKCLHDALDRLFERGADVILLDLGLPDSSGIETVQRTARAFPRVPILVLTGLGDETMGLRALHEGADDYLVKGCLSGHLLVRGMRYAIERQQHHDRARALADQQARRLGAEAAVRARDELIASAAHELRTPIAALQVTIDALRMKDRVTESVLRQKVEVLERHSYRLARLVDNLLDVSCAQAGRLTLARTPVDLADVTRTVLSDFESELSRAQCPISFQTNGDTRGVWDIGYLEQIVTNLLTNAFKFGASKPINITIDGDGELVRFTIKDHGIGIAPEMQQRIFGLFLVQQLVRAHSGAVSVVSEPGAGSMFVVELPRLEMPDRDSVPSDRDDNVAEAPPTTTATG
jgi:phosphoserine phosphatase RsbU/P